MFNFCPHCGKMIGQEQTPGKVLLCKWCQKPIGKPSSVSMDCGTVVTQRGAVDLTQQAIGQGKAARCPRCQQVVELKASGTNKTFVPHYTVGEKRRICQGSGKPVGN